MLWSTALAEAGAAEATAGAGGNRWMVGVVAAGSWTGGGERSGPPDRTDGAAGLVRTARRPRRKPSCDRFPVFAAPPGG